VLGSAATSRGNAVFWPSPSVFAETRLTGPGTPPQHFAQWRGLRHEQSGARPKSPNLRKRPGRASRSCRSPALRGKRRCAWGCRQGRSLRQTNGNYRYGYFTAEAKEQHRIRRFGSFQTTVHSAIPLGELALPSGKLRHPAGRVAHAWRVFLARIPIPSDYQSACQVCWPWQPIALKARRGAICQSLLCFRKRPLILKQLIF
jgi:hypothetical protein